MSAILTDRRPVVYAFLSAVLLVYSVLNAQRLYSEPHWLQLPLRLTKYYAFTIAVLLIRESE